MSDCCRGRKRTTVSRAIVALIAAAGISSAADREAGKSPVAGGGPKPEAVVAESYVLPGVERVFVLRPRDLAVAERIVFVLSGQAGWKGGVRRFARALASDAVVAGISTPQWIRASGAGGESGCWNPGDDLTRAGEALRRRIGLEREIPTILVGQSLGAAVAYGALAGSSVGRFPPVVAVAFCDWIPPVPALCPGGVFRTTPGEHMGKPVQRLSTVPGHPGRLFVVHGEKDRMCPLETAKRLVEAMPAARIEVVERGDHATFGDPRWREAVERAIAEITGPPPSDP